jgi:hypothetical protein
LPTSPKLLVAKAEKTKVKKSKAKKAYEEAEDYLIVAHSSK